MRFLLPCLLCVGCVTVSTETKTHEGRVGVHSCETAAVVATVEPNSHDSVRLTFQRQQRCVGDYEAAWETESHRELWYPMRVGLAVVAAVAVSGGIALALSSVHGLDAKSLGEGFGWIVVPPGLAAGVGMYAATGTKSAVERSIHLLPTTNAREEVSSHVTEGTFEAPGVSARALVLGAVALTLEESLQLRAGPLTLDGEPVTIDLESDPLIAALSACAPASPGPELEADRQQRAVACRAAGWNLVVQTAARIDGLEQFQVSGAGTDIVLDQPLGRSVSRTDASGRFVMPRDQRLDGQLGRLVVAGTGPMRIVATPDAPEIPDGATEPTLRKASMAKYPQPALVNHLEGTVLLRLIVDDTGRVANATVLAGPGDGMNEAASDAVMNATFTPAMKDGQPVWGQLIYRYVFKL